MSAQFKLPAGVRWSTQLIVTLCVCAVAGGVLAVEGLPVLIAAVRPSADIEAVDTTTPLLKNHEENSKKVLNRLEGRSMFVKPKPWNRLRPPPPPVPVDTKPPPPPVDPIPASYTGPKPIGMFGNTVFFEGGVSVEEGKETGGVTLVQIVSAWELKLKHKKGSYTVPFGVKPNDELFQKPSTRSSVPGVTVSGASGTAGGSAAGGPTPAGSTSGATISPAAGSVSGAAVATPPLSKTDIDAMTPEVAKSTLETLIRAQTQDGLDDATKARLQQEIDWLGERLKPN